MLGYIVRRLASTVLVMAIVGVFVFLLLHLSPGDPAAIIAGDNATPRADRRASASSSASTIRCRCSSCAGPPRVLQGDLGISIFSNEPVTKLIGQRIEPTLSLALTTLVVAVTLAVSFGVLAAWKVGSLDRPLADGRVGARLLGAGVRRRLHADLPLRDQRCAGCRCRATRRSPRASARGSSTSILPSIALGLAYVALIARITRTAMLDVLAEDYIRTAQAPRASRRARCC